MNDWRAQWQAMVPASLQAELELAPRRRRALIVRASSEGCPWCRLVRRSCVAPLLADAANRALA